MIAMETDDAGRLFQRWMNAGKADAARLHQPVVVQVQRLNDGATAGSATDQAQAILAPGEVVAPDLGVWVEERDDGATLRFAAAQGGAFEFVAAITSQTKVGAVRSAASRQGDNVVHHHGDARQFRAAAIATAITGTRGYPSPQRRGDFTTHRREGAKGGIGNVWPRHFSKARA